jgi:AbrB family looped-hinge helix DNA binding protein
MKVKESHTRINRNGRVVIPASFRRALGINPGETVVLRLENDELRITTLRQRLANARQLVRARVPPTTSLADEIIAERREAERREQDCVGRFGAARHSPPRAGFGNIRPAI